MTSHRRRAVRGAPTAPALLLLLGCLRLRLRPASAESESDCSSFKCHHGSKCTEGNADYGPITDFNYYSPIMWMEETSIDGEHCRCGDGYTGVSCKRKYEICDETTNFACFHGATCVALGGSAKWGCDCTKAVWGGDKEFFAGLHCEYRASDTCAIKDKDGLEEGRWFCANKGECHDDQSEVLKKCKCRDDWFGPHCEYHKNGQAWQQNRPQHCTLNCRNGGQCVFGFKDYGAHAKDNSAHVNFTNEKHDGQGQHCVCPDGYTGLICQIKAQKCGDRLWCYNGAECAKTNMEDGTTRKYCDCKPAAGKNESYAGVACQHQSGVFCNPDEGSRKDMSFCVNKGTCWEDNQQHLGCTCPDEYTGQHCEIHKEKEPEMVPPPEDECKLQCKNGGKCAKGVKDYGKLAKYDVPQKDQKDFEHCICPEGYTGLDCSVQVEFCSPVSRQICFYGSECIPTGEISANGKDEYKCGCDKGKTPEGLPVAGRYCEHYATDICAANDKLTDWHSFCTNGGTCVNSEVGPDEPHGGCFCLDDWTGDFCERRVRKNDKQTTTAAAGSGGSAEWRKNVPRMVGAAVGLASLAALVW